MNVPLVSIGMPVFNGERYFRRALESVLTQDYPRLEIIVSDNASTDGSHQIALNTAARDERIRVVSATSTRDPMWNFGRVLELASGEYFAWAAHDDSRDLNFVSSLSALLGADRRAVLACPRIVKVTPDGTPSSTHPFPDPLPARDLARMTVLMRSAQAAWVYGLFNTAFLRAALNRLPTETSPWGLDHLIILRCLIEGRLVGSNMTTLYQAKTGLSASLYKPAGVLRRAKHHAFFLRHAFGTLRSSPLPAARKLQLAPFLVLYLEQHLAHWRRGSLPQLGVGAARRVRRAWQQLSRP